MGNGATDTGGARLSDLLGVDDPTDYGAARRAIVRVTAQLIDLLIGLDRTDAAIPGLEWTVAGTAAHLVKGFRAFAAAVEGRLDGWGTPAADAVLSSLAEIPDQHDPRTVARQLGHAVDAFLSASADRSPDDRFPTPWYTVDRTNCVGPMTCLLLGELVIHGVDISAGAGRPWPIDADDARRIITGVFPVKIPVLVNPDTTKGLKARVELAVDGGPTLVVQFSDGTATVEPANTGPVDCHVGGDPTAVLLLAYGRAASDELFTQGRLRAWGTDPALGVKFKSYMKNP